MSSLWDTSDPELWQQALDGYWDAVTGVSKGKKDRLPSLDRWYFEELPKLIKSRDPAYLTKDELVKLVDWKLTRGKWRPRLLQFAQDAEAAAVEEASRKGLAHLAGQGEGGQGPPPAAVKSALAEVTVLKGVGPATASAVLSAADPSVPFMSDEALEAALGSRDYTVPQYLQLLEELRGKAEELSGKGDRCWTAQEVERCLFAEAATAAVASQPPPAKKRKK